MGCCRGRGHRPKLFERGLAERAYRLSLGYAREPVQGFPIPAMGALRERTFTENPHLAHDLSALRRPTQAQAQAQALRESNGNADLQRIGLAGHFVFQLGAREHGAAKPDPGIFLAACTRLG